MLTSRPSTGLQIWSFHVVVSNVVSDVTQICQNYKSLFRACRGHRNDCESNHWNVKSVFLTGLLSCSDPWRRWLWCTHWKSATKHWGRWPADQTWTRKTTILCGLRKLTQLQDDARISLTFEAVRATSIKSFFFLFFFFWKLESFLIG